MTPGLNARDRDLLAAFPGMASVVDDLFAAAWESSDPRLLELCRLRLAELLGHDRARGQRTPEAVAAGLDEDQVEQLSCWPTSVAFDARERACLALAEQFAIDVQGIDQALVDDVRGALSDPAAFAFLAALWPIEQQLRWSLTVERLFGEAGARENTEGPRPQEGP